MNSTNCCSKEIVDEIMATTVYFKLCSKSKSKIQIKKDLNQLINVCKTFESNYSRFILNNILQKFNNSKSGKLTKEFYSLLKISKKYNTQTKGLFDIGILPVLQNQGYTVSKLKGYTDNSIKIGTKDKFTSIKNLKLNNNNTYEKPVDLKIDLGGIGKGFLINKLKNILLKKGYKNFIIDLGGDIYFKGKDIEQNVNFYVCGVSNPLNNKTNIEHLKLKNRGVATSTTTKRKWIISGNSKNHLINPHKNSSTASNIIQCTVVSKNIIKADILAKSLLLMGLKKALLYAKIHKVSAIFITKKFKLYKTPYVKKYIY